MDLRRFKNIENAVPVFSGLRAAHEFYKERGKTDPAAKQELMKAVGQVLELDVTANESELIADILIELLNQAEKDIRMALSEQLSVLENVPLRLILKISNDEIDIARPVLTQSTVLGDYDLLYIIKSKTPEYWEAIARRKALGEEIINTLSDTGDFNTALALAKNQNIELTQYAAVALSKLASGSEELSQPLLMRPELPRDVVAYLYKHVGEQVKQRLGADVEIDFVPILEDAVDTAVINLLGELDLSLGHEYMPSEELIMAARYHHQQGYLNQARFIENLQRGQVRNFVAQFSVYNNLDVNVVLNAIDQKSGENLAIICKGMGISRNDFISLYILLRSVDTKDDAFYDVKLINNASESYDNIPDDEAKAAIKPYINA
ncbi:MAG: DUF2336 domain-containing protein [Alphaproteobacteria bacterium]|nr:DUF2336 domain-containing protein [Alphaproteobacteria bacterium]